MSQNTIIKGKDNPVVILFDGIDLTLLTDIRATYGADSRLMSTSPSSIVVISSSELELNFQDTTETIAQYWCIDGIDALNPLGVELTGSCLRNLNKSPICEGC